MRRAAAALTAPEIYFRLAPPKDSAMDTLESAMGRARLRSSSSMAKLDRENV